MKSDELVSCFSKGVKMSDCIDDMEAFSHLTDNIFHQILLASEENLTAEDRADLRAAKEILLSIQRRQLYPCLYQSPPLAGTTFSTVRLVSDKISTIRECYIRFIIRNKHFYLINRKYLKI